MRRRLAAVLLIVLVGLVSGCGGGGTISLEETLKGLNAALMEEFVTFDRVAFKAFFSTSYLAAYEDQSAGTQQYMDDYSLGSEMDYDELMVHIDRGFDDIIASREQAEAAYGITIEMSSELVAFEIISSTENTALVSSIYVLTDIITDNASGQVFTQENSSPPTESTWVKEGSTWRIISYEF